MDERDLARGVRVLLADAQIASQRATEREAAGWVVVTIDDESNEVVFVTGDFPTPEAALIDSQKMYAEDARHNDGSEPGWTHVVAPRFEPGT